MGNRGEQIGSTLARPFILLRERLHRNPKAENHRNTLEGAFLDYAYRLLGSYGIFEANSNASMRIGESHQVDQGFINRFARHALYHADPQFRIAFSEEDAHLEGEEATWDQAATKAWRVIVDAARSNGDFGKLQAELRGELAGRRVWLFPQYNRPAVGWEVRKIYRETREGLARRNNVQTSDPGEEGI